jgi:4-amino-4-deoxy-L-arabinose transferase-like glycosyltransferase
MTVGEHPVGWREHLAGFLLGAAYVALLLPTSADLAMSRDESFYVSAADNHAGWYRQLFEDSDVAFEDAAIHRGFSYNSEHPALMKTLFAFSAMANEAWELFPQPSMAYRFPGMVTAGLLLWLILVFGARAFGPTAGAFGAAAFALMPRIFYHSHLDCFDIPITFMVMLVAYCYWRALDSPKWAIWTGITFGLALATKHNSWLLPGIFLVHWLWTLAGERRARKRGEPARVGTFPWWLVAMVLIGPAIFVGSWPWLWSETLPRIGSYMSFHFGHEYYNIVYFGETYFRPPFPKSLPYVLIFFTVPLGTVALALGGLGCRLRAILPPWLAARIWKDGRVAPDRRATDVLLAGLLLAPIVVYLLPTTPIFGGTKHWFPAYPPLCIFAGLGFVRLVEASRTFLEPRLPRAVPYLPAAVAAAMLLPAAIETVHSHPFGLSHYTYAAGGVPGAADHGMNRQFWGFTTGSIAGYFREQLPDGGRVYVCDQTPGSWEMMQRDGMIPDNIRPSGDIVHSDFSMVHHEDHFAEVDYQAWVAYGSVQPSHVLTYDGVPIITVYANPRQLERARRRREERAQGIGGSKRGPVR